MTDMTGLFPVAVSALLVVGTRLLGLRAPRAAAAGDVRTRERIPAVWQRARFSPTLAVLWTLFLACAAILATRDPLYAASLVITAASSCKLRRLYQPHEPAHGPVQATG